MRIGKIYRYPKLHEAHPEMIDGYENFFSLTSMPSGKCLQLDRGIFSPQPIKGADNILRRPVILISSSPHKAGSTETPWNDSFDPDFGSIRYFGDNKPSNKPESKEDPAEAPGNRVLLAAFKEHSSPNPLIRAQSVPLVFFLRVPVDGKVKGFVKFQGFGVIQSVELVTQLEAKTGTYFSNFAYDMAVLRMDYEHESFSWDWIRDRGNRALNLEETLRYAPKSWKDWIAKGNTGIGGLLRKASKLKITEPKDQMPGKRSKEEKILIEVYDYYNDPSKKKYFEALALFISERAFGHNKKSFVRKWITPSSADNGVDFVGRIDMGSGFSRIKQIVLGQAKCRKLDTPTNAEDIARTVARLKRGWVGVFVTTSYFSRSAQQEMIEDQYPIMLIPGKTVASIICAEMLKKGMSSVPAFLSEIDNTYDSLLHIRRPEEALRE